MFLFQLPKQVPVSAGSTYAGAKLYFYLSGTSTAATVYSDSDLTTAHAVPVVASNAGVFAAIYLDDTVAYKVKLTTSAGSLVYEVDPINEVSVWQDITTAETAAGLALADLDTDYAPGNVLRYGAVADGLTDDYEAFADAWSVIKSTGGSILIPPGNYLLNTTWTLDVDLTAPHNYEVLGYGATLLAGTSVTGHAIKVYKSYNNAGVKIEGLGFNHRGNTTVSGCIEAAGAHYLRVVKCYVEHHDTKAAYAAIKLGPYTAGTASTNSFWSLIDQFTTRMRSGGDGTDAAVGILLYGEANATTITNCSFDSVTHAVKLTTDGVADGVANAVNVAFNAFEGVTNCVTVDTTGSTYMPTGLRLAFNRAESATTFLNLIGTAATDTSYPPSTFGNYLTVGSVTNYLVNTNSQYVFSHEPSYYGVGARNFVGGPADYRIVTEGTGKNLVLGDIDGSSDYEVGHIVLGTYHLWVNTGDGKLYIKSSAPTAADDGTVVGTQS